LKRLFTYLVLAVCLLAVVLWLAGQVLLSSERFENRVTKLVAQKLGMECSYQKASLALVPFGRLKLSAARLGAEGSSSDSTHSESSGILVDSLYLRPSLWALLKGQLSIAELKVAGLKVSGSRGKQGEWNLPVPPRLLARLLSKPLKSVTIASMSSSGSAGLSSVSSSDKAAVASASSDEMHPDTAELVEAVIAAQNEKADKSRESVEAASPAKAVSRRAPKKRFSAKSWLRTHLRKNLSVDSLAVASSDFEFVIDNDKGFPLKLSLEGLRCSLDDAMLSAEGEVQADQLVLLGVPILRNIHFDISTSQPGVHRLDNFYCDEFPKGLIEGGLEVSRRQAGYPWSLNMKVDGLQAESLWKELLNKLPAEGVLGDLAKIGLKRGAVSFASKGFGYMSQPTSAALGFRLNSENLVLNDIAKAFPVLEKRGANAAFLRSLSIPLFEVEGALQKMSLELRHFKCFTEHGVLRSVGRASVNGGLQSSSRAYLTKEAADFLSRFLKEKYPLFAEQKVFVPFPRTDWWYRDLHLQLNGMNTDNVGNQALGLQSLRGNFVESDQLMPLLQFLSQLKNSQDRSL